MCVLLLCIYIYIYIYVERERERERERDINTLLFCVFGTHPVKAATPTAGPICLARLGNNNDNDDNDNDNDNSRNNDHSIVAIIVC